MECENYKDLDQYLYSSQLLPIMPRDNAFIFILNN